MDEYILEPKRNIPVIENADLCVIGGSCTGVFAAVRAARLGLKVVLIERHNMLGGTAVTGLVNIWHSLHDTDSKNRIIGGLTYETLTLLKKRDAVVCSLNPNSAYNFNPWELTLILDQYIKENKICVMLHTLYCGAIKQDRKVKAVIVENADGRGAVKANFFIDASGDGRLARDLGIEHYVHKNIQPPTSCFYLTGDTSRLNLGKLVCEHGQEFGLDDDWGWSINLANVKGITLRADNHIFNVRTDRAADLTLAEIEGRRKADAFACLLRKYANNGEEYKIVGMCSNIGVRETVHYKTKFKATASALLLGERYKAPVLNGTYRVDVHHSHDNGITFKYLDGTQQTLYGKEERCEISNWREKEGISGEPAKFYQVPFDILVQEDYDNLISVGRMLNADPSAFGALRVMVNLNQLGEAAGVGAYLCVNGNEKITDLPACSVTNKLREGGSVL